MRNVLLTAALSLTLALAAPMAVRVVDVLDASGGVVASGSLDGHLRVSGVLSAARSVRVSVTVNGVTTVRVFQLAGPIVGREPEAERLGVLVSGQVLTLEAAVEGERAEGARGRGADDGAGHDAGDDHGGASGGHGADDGAGHDAGDDHGGASGGHGADDGAGHDAGDDHGGGSGSGGSGGGGEHGGGHH